VAGWLHTEINVRHWELNPDTVAHLSTNRSRRRLTSKMPDHQTKQMDTRSYMYMYNDSDGIGVARILSFGALFPQKVDDLFFSRRLQKTV